MHPAQAGTSFVHYARYIATYYYRDNVAYEDFKRDALLYKSLALLQLAYFYLEPFGFNPVDAVASDKVAALMIAGALSLSLFLSLFLSLPLFLSSRSL